MTALSDALRIEWETSPQGVRRRAAGLTVAEAARRLRTDARLTRDAERARGHLSRADAAELRQLELYASRYERLVLEGHGAERLPSDWRLTDHRGRPIDDRPQRTFLRRVR